MNVPLIIRPVPQRQHPETEMELFQRMAEQHEFERRLKRREERRARLLSLVQRKAA